MIDQLFFLIGAPRSGTTSLAKTLDTATNATVDVESNPKLCISARLHYLNTLPAPQSYIQAALGPNLATRLNENAMYGDKNPNYVYFIPELFQAFHCRFVFILRDGRDVVRSCMDFNAFRSETYHRYEDGPQFTITEPEADFWDFSRLRPRPDEALPKPWMEFTKFEKYCWSWTRMNQLILDAAQLLPDESYRFFRMNTASDTEYQELFTFLGLQGFDREKVLKLSNASINGTAKSDVERFPSWPDWTKEHTASFNHFAGPMMQQLDFS
jgi:hypothetical protein